MRRLTRFAAAIAALAAAALIGCSESMVQPTVSQRAPSASPGRVITPVLSDVIVNTTGGSFANAIVPTEAGRGTGAFWDNVSSDDHDPPVAQCNIGFFAIGTISPLCNFTTPGSTPGGYANYFGNGPGNTGSPDFMFNGKYSYEVTLVGAYSFGSSTVGYFTKSGGVYTFTAVPQWSNKQIGVTVSFTTPGNVDWGFFASNTNFTGQRTCGATINTSCSDAIGGFTTTPLQQHALFINSAGDQFLVGLEDNLLGLWNGDCNHATGAGGPACTPDNPTNQDSDYQDYIFKIVPHIIPPVGKSFTIGPSSMEGAIRINAGDWVNGGYSFKFVSAHTATDFTVNSFVTIQGPCRDASGHLTGTTDAITVPMGTVTYAIPASSKATDWLPTGDANSVLSWEGSVQAPAGLCGGGGNQLDASKGAIYHATVSQNPPSGSLVDFRFKYRDPAAKDKPNTNCLDTSDPNRAKADVCGASWSQTVRDP